MRKLALFLLSLFIPFAAIAANKTVKIDPAQSTLSWTGEKVTGSHSGTVTVKSGSAILSGDNLVGGEFEIDMSSINVSDQMDTKNKTKLTKHLLSDDFFGASNFPTAVFKITSAEKISNAAPGGPNYNIMGNLTVKGLTFPITFPATIDVKGGIASASASAEIDRTKYNVRYGSGKFFQNLGDKLIYDNFKVNLALKGKVEETVEESKA